MILHSEMKFDENGKKMKEKIEKKRKKKVLGI